MLKKLLGQTAIYGISTIIGRAANFLLVPFYTSASVLSMAQYGVVTELYSYMAFLNIVFQFGLETTYFRFSNKLEDESRVFNVLQTLMYVWVGLLFCLLFLSSSMIASFLHVDDDGSLLKMLFGIIAIDSIVAIPFARLRFSNKAKLFAGVRLLNIFLNIGLNLFFLLLCPYVQKGEGLQFLRAFVDAVYFPEIKLSYVFISNLLANAMFLPLLLKSIFNYRFTVDKILFKETITYSFPIMVMGLAGMINEVIDRVLLKFYLPKSHGGFTRIENVAIYGAVYKLSIFMTLIIQAFRYAAEPFFFSKAKDRNAPEVYANVLKWFVIACSAVFLTVSLLRQEIAHVVITNNDYHVGLFIVPILLGANLFLGVYYNQSVWYKLSDKTYFGTIIGGFGAIVTVVVNLILIPKVGILGSAIATIVCYASMSILSFVLGNKYYPVPYRIRSAVFYISIAAVFVVLSYFLNFGFVIDLFVKLGLMVTYFTIVYLIELKWKLKL